MPCIASSVGGLFCKYHEGLLYSDDFTTPLAGRWRVLNDHSGAAGDKWSIVDVGALPYWTETGSTKALRVRHDAADDAVAHMIVNEELVDAYVEDEAGRDKPWFNVRIDVEGTPDIGHFPYDLPAGGMVHRVHNADASFFLAMHRHRCGLFGTWVYEWIYDDSHPGSGAGYLALGPLVNLIDDWWGIKQHVDDGAIVMDQFLPPGWAVGGDHWDVPVFPYDTINGQFGLATQSCASWGYDGYVYFRDFRVFETNYVELRGIPPSPDGAGAEGATIPGYPLPYGKWWFRLTHPSIGVSNQSEHYPARDATETVFPMDHNNQTWQSLEWWFVPVTGGVQGTPVLIDTITPPTGVNGGDVYWLELSEPPAWPPGGDSGVSVQGGCADYEQIWLHAPVLNDYETGFIPGDTHQYARQIKGFGALTIDGDATFVIGRYRGENPPLITKTTTPVDNGDGSYDITVLLSASETSQIGDQDAYHFQLQFTLDDASVVTPNAGLIKGIPFKVNV